MSADEAALVRAILSDPHDGLTRSAYADWLEEQGKPRHAELQRMRPTRMLNVWLLPAAEWQQQRDLVAEIARPIDPWTCGAPHMGDDGLLEITMASQVFSFGPFQERAACLRDNHVSRVCLDGDSEDWAAVGNAPALEHLHALCLKRCTYRLGGARVLATAAGMGRLSSLRLGRKEGLTSFAVSEAMPGLVHLDLSNCQVGQGLLRALAGGPLAGRLRHVNLSDNRIGDRGLGSPLRLPAFLSGLVSLQLQGCAIGDRGIKALASSPHLGGLRYLNLKSNGMTAEDGFASLAGSGLLDSLRRLEIGLGSIGPLAGITAVVKAAADHPQLTIGLSGDVSPDEAAEYEDLIGGRLILIRE